MIHQSALYGCFADQRFGFEPDSDELKRAILIMENLDEYVNSVDFQNMKKAQQVALKLMQNLVLDEADERFLLEKLQTCDV